MGLAGPTQHRALCKHSASPRMWLGEGCRGTAALEFHFFQRLWQLPLPSDLLKELPQVRGGSRSTPRQERALQNQCSPSKHEPGSSCPHTLTMHGAPLSDVSRHAPPVFGEAGTVAVTVPFHRWDTRSSEMLGTMCLSCTGSKSISVHTSRCPEPVHYPRSEMFRVGPHLPPPGRKDGDEVVAGTGDISKAQEASEMALHHPDPRTPRHMVGPGVNALEARAEHGTGATVCS